jgi:hypothetical protein
MAWRTKSGQSSPDEPSYRRGTEPIKGYMFRQDDSPAKRLVHETERHLRWQAMSPQERSDFTQKVLWGDDDE